MKIIQRSVIVDYVNGTQDLFDIEKAHYQQHNVILEFPVKIHEDGKTTKVIIIPLNRIHKITDLEISENEKESS